jgi:hypothetical protein
MTRSEYRPLFYLLALLDGRRVKPSRPRCALAHALETRGAQVTVLGRDGAKGRQAVRELSAMGGEYRFERIDLARVDTAGSIGIWLSNTIGYPLTASRRTCCLRRSCPTSRRLRSSAPHVSYSGKPRPGTSGCRRSRRTRACAKPSGPSRDAHRHFVQRRARGEVRVIPRGDVRANAARRASESSTRP